MDIVKKKESRAPDSTSMSNPGTPPIYGGRKRKAVVTVKKKVMLNLRKMGLDELFGKTLHYWKDGPIEAWVTPDDELRLKAFRSNGVIDVIFE
jgi:hypothetical protein